MEWFVKHVAFYTVVIDKDAASPRYGFLLCSWQYIQN